MIEAIAVYEYAKPSEHLITPGVVDVDVGTEWDPEARRTGNVPNPRAGAGEVEVDERNSSAFTKDDVVEVGVIVTDEFVHY
jgi:hypothetical protein